MEDAALIEVLKKELRRKEKQIHIIMRWWNLICKDCQAINKLGQLEEEIKVKKKKNKG